MSDKDRWLQVSTYFVFLCQIETVFVFQKLISFKSSIAIQKFSREMLANVSKLIYFGIYRNLFVSSSFTKSFTATVTGYSAFQHFLRFRTRDIFAFDLLNRSRTLIIFDNFVLFRCSIFAIVALYGSILDQGHFRRFRFYFDLKSWIVSKKL